MDFFDALSPKTIDEDTFFPKGHEVLVRPSDKKALFNRVIETASLYKIFYEFLFEKSIDTTFIDTEIEYIINMRANIVAEINGTTGSGKSQLSRRLAKKIAIARHANIRFIINGELYEKSGGKKGALLITLNKNFKDVMNCYITYSFFETSNMIIKLSKKDMIIQDEIEKAMGTDSKLIKQMIENILNINVRKNMVSVIFNTPSFVPIKQINFIIETFGIKNNGNIKPENLNKDNMITYGIIYDKNSKPYAISKFSVWESQKEHDFYENMSQTRKDEFKKTGGGKRVVPDMAVVEKSATILVDYARKRGVYKKDTLKTLGRYIPEFGGMPSGMLVDVVNLAHDELTKDQEEGGDNKPRRKKGKSIAEVKAEKEQSEDHDFPTDCGSDQWTAVQSGDAEGGDIAGSSIEPVSAPLSSGSASIISTTGTNGIKPILEFVSESIKRDFGDYYQNLWDYIVGAGMTYDMVAERIKKDGIVESHMTVGNDFNKVRVGSQKDGIPTGMGYYVELWWALKHNTKEYVYIPPKNKDLPDYINQDGTVDSVKSVWEKRRTYFTPSKDCMPEIKYCRDNNLPSFRLIFINFSQTTDKFIKKVIPLNEIEKRVIFTPSMFKAMEN